MGGIMTHSTAPPISARMGYTRVGLVLIEGVADFFPGMLIADLDNRSRTLLASSLASAKRQTATSQPSGRSTAAARQSTIDGMLVAESHPRTSQACCLSLW